VAEEHAHPVGDGPARDPRVLGRGWRLGLADRPQQGRRDQEGDGVGEHGQRRRQQLHERAGHAGTGGGGGRVADLEPAVALDQVLAAHQVGT
jgi:hypothetical protein